MSLLSYHPFSPSFLLRDLSEGSSSRPRYFFFVGPRAWFSPVWAVVLPFMASLVPSLFFLLVTPVFISCISCFPDMAPFGNGRPFIPRLLSVDSCLVAVSCALS